MGWNKIYHNYTGRTGLVLRQSWISEVNIGVGLTAEDVDGVGEDLVLFVLLLPREVNPVVSIARHQDDGQDDEDDKEDDDGEVLADLGDGVGEAFEVWVGVGAVGDHEEVLDGSPSQVGGGGTGETSLVLR